MADIFQRTIRPADDLFVSGNDANDPRMSGHVLRDPADYDRADIVILGYPHDDGIRRCGGRTGAASAPAAIRERFYTLTTLGVRRRIFDLGDLDTDGSLEATHELHAEVVGQLLRDGKQVIVIGGGGDVSYADGAAMADVFGPEWWIGVNIDALLDVDVTEGVSSHSAYRHLLEEGLLQPKYFYEVAFQLHLASPVYFEYIRDAGIHRISLDLLGSRSAADLEIKEQIRHEFIGHSSSLKTMFGFDLGAVRASDAPGTAGSSPLGLSADEFMTLVKYAASLANTKIVEFTETNPTCDIDGRTAMLVAIAMHRVCSGTV